MAQATANRLLHAMPARYGGPDYAVAVLISSLTGMAGAGLGLVLLGQTERATTPAAMRTGLLVGAAVAGVLLGLVVAFRGKAGIRLYANRLVVAYPWLPWRLHQFKLQEISQLRFGETPQGYWLVVHLQPRPGLPDAYELKLEADEADIVALARETEGIGIPTLLFGEI